MLPGKAKVRLDQALAVLRHEVSTVRGRYQEKIEETYKTHSKILKYYLCYPEFS